jgi:LacI family transcriptional regulator
MPATPTMLDVAAKAGVSIATVSRVLTNKGRVSQDVRASVTRAVHELGYRPNRQARNFRTQQTHVIGVAISDIENPFCTSIVRAIEDVANARQFSLWLCNTDEDLRKERKYLDLMLDERVAGVIASPTAESDTSLHTLVDAGIPVVAIDRRSHKTPVDTVLLDNVSAAAQLTRHLVAHGHRRIGALIGTSRMTSGAERLRGFLSVLEEAGVPADMALVREVMPAEISGYEAAFDLLSLPEPPSALYTGNNLITIGALKAIRAKGLRIPHDISIVAQDDLPWMALLDVGLTVAAQPVYEMGRIATELLLSRIDGDAHAPREIRLAPDIIIRDSCAGVPARIGAEIAVKAGGV